MKFIITTFTMVFLFCSVFAQIDSTKSRTADSIRIGGMIIVNNGKTDDKPVKTDGYNRHNSGSNISTSEFIFDLGFANWTDQTDYAGVTSQDYLINRPGSPSLDKNDFKLRTGKSVNVNIWLFMQRLNLIKHYVNLKYGLGIELNNYRFKSDITFKENGVNPYNTSQAINHPFIFRDSISINKDKLAADYVTVPMMLNFRSDPENSRKGISLSGGVSIGYLYSSRNKQKSNERGKHKNRGDYDLEPWKFSYIAELGLGPIHLYGSYSPKSIFANGLKMLPYNIGIRFSNW